MIPAAVSGIPDKKSVKLLKTHAVFSVMGFQLLVWSRDTAAPKRTLCAPWVQRTSSASVKRFHLRGLVGKIPAEHRILWREIVVEPAQDIVLVHRLIAKSIHRPQNASGQNTVRVRFRKDSQCIGNRTGDHGVGSCHGAC